ncbi:MAG: hypothetical protein KKG04_02330 [Candidatus Thermoplasmatota archaeon]|nr:hypothetical protein [Candidatus Thermoplasmatota archaeon]
MENKIGLRDNKGRFTKGHAALPQRDPSTGKFTPAMGQQKYKELCRFVDDLPGIEVWEVVLNDD